jgi:uncharacterized protein
MPKVRAGEPTWVIDKAEVLSRLNEGRLSDKLDDLAKKTGKEVRMVTIHRLDYGETAESFTKALFEKWFPTPEAQANQGLLVIDTVTNTTAIQTGEARQVNSARRHRQERSVRNGNCATPRREQIQSGFIRCKRSLSCCPIW